MFSKVAPFHHFYSTKVILKITLSPSVNGGVGIGSGSKFSDFEYAAYIVSLSKDIRKLWIFVGRLNGSVAN